MNSLPLDKIVVVCGPTASGKSELALRLAKGLDAEIVNADSMQIYRGLDIGTAKPSLEQQASVRHHLIDVADPEQLFSAADFADAADKTIKDIISRGKRVIIAGGTGLYIRALIHGLADLPSGGGEHRAALQLEAERRGKEAMLEKLRIIDPVIAAGLHPNNLVRILRALEVYLMTGVPLSRYQKEHGFSASRYSVCQIGITVDRRLLYDRIDERVEQMMDSGLLAEVEGLLASGYGRDLKPMRSIGYKEAAAHLSGELSREEAVRLIKRDTRHYAKRQLTWFKADKNIMWFEYPEKFGTVLKYTFNFFEQQEDNDNGQGTF
jgi:tRNA dimethylallyltransferase